MQSDGADLRHRFHDVVPKEDDLRGRNPGLSFRGERPKACLLPLLHRPQPDGFDDGGVDCVRLSGMVPAGASNTRPRPESSNCRRSCTGP